MNELKENRAIRPDAQACDEIRITTVPRYKESGMSGDEWRISAKVEFIRKGKVVHEEWRSNLEYAVRLLDSDLVKSYGKWAFFGGEGDLCDQEGCANKATVKKVMKKEYCRSGHGEASTIFRHYRLFCGRHSTRGDCSLEDSDRNYESVDLLK